MVESLSLARVKATGNGRISHASPENTRVIRLGSDWLWACIHGSNRMVFFHPQTHTVQSSVGNPQVTTDGSLAVAVVRPHEILRIGLQKGQYIDPNHATAVLAY